MRSPVFMLTLPLMLQWLETLPARGAVAKLGMLTPSMKYPAAAEPASARTIGTLMGFRERLISAS